MTQGKRERVSIAISISEKDLEHVRDQVFADVLKRSGADGVNTVETELIAVTSSMSARLTGSPNLQIKDLSTQEQLIMPSEPGKASKPTVWRWEVLPTDRGDGELYLVLSTHSRSADGYPGAKDLDPITLPIHVTIEPLYWVQRFFTDNLAVLVGMASLITSLVKVPWKRFWTWIIVFLKKRSQSIRRRWHRARSVKKTPESRR